ncbi:LPXTG cell wall anchor domain-containing protein [Acidianus sp. HS-5]|uniref:LPXTG cell wall anchor domain-containing protein n=1 Tax=Acidianus sp. HS-5 TaxID=2886040 RepID=UPI001F02708E|nr:LPXTG cell wall anchor domain-containing protein [Acidianus sp. HS-5]
MTNMIVFVASATTSASPASIPFENFFGFLLAGLAILAGIGYYLLMRKKAI